MRVAEIIANGEALLGQSVRIEGYFIFVGTRGYFVDSIDGRDDLSNAVRVSLENLKRVVSSRVPPSGGSQYYYLDSAVLQGKLQRSDEVEFKFQCADIELFEITKANHHFVVFP